MHSSRHAAHAGADAPRPRLGDRVEAALEQRSDLAAELERGAAEEKERESRRSGALRRTAFWLVVSAVSLYLVAPAVIDVLGSWRQIVELPLAWLAVMAVLQAAALACMWWLQRIAIHVPAWRPVIASQLAGNSLAKIAPGGGAMGAALQYRMLVASGTPPGQAAAGLTAASLLTLAVVLALPVLALPAILRGGIEPDLLAATIIGLGVFVLLFAAGATCVASDRPLLWVGRTVQRVRNRLRRGSAPLERLPQRLIAERDRILTTVGARLAGRRSSPRSGAGHSTSPVWWRRWRRSTPCRVRGSCCSRSARRSCSRRYRSRPAASASSRPGWRRRWRSRASHRRRR